MSYVDSIMKIWNLMLEVNRRGGLEDQPVERDAAT